MKQYFASLPTEDLVQDCYEKIRKFYQDTSRSKERERCDKAVSLYYGQHGVGDTSKITALGDNGEIMNLSVNDFRNLIRHTVALTTSTKPSYDPRAKNSDLKSLQQARLASNILDSYLVEKRMGRHMASACERALVAGKAYVYMTWNPALGKPYGTQAVTAENGQPVLDDNGEPQEKIVFEGDVEIGARSRFDVIYNRKLREWTSNKWVIVKSLVNRWDQIARYPHIAEQLAKLPSIDELDDYSIQKSRTTEDQEDDELIPVYEFYHLKTDAVQSGRYMKFFGGDLCAYDGPMQYKRLPVFPILPGEVFDSVEGYTDAFDIMGLQDAQNVLYSIPFTNQQALGVQFIHLPDGCNLAETSFKGLAVLRGGPPGTEPKALQLTSTAAEVFKNIDVLKSAMRMGMGLNATVTGDPEANLKSGAALGRMQAMAIQYNSTLQKSWAELQEDCGTFLLELLQAFAKSERMVALAGKHNKGAMVSFTGNDLIEIERVAVDLGNPLSRTAAGRLELADNLLERNQINAKQYMQVATTGQLDTIFESEESELELIRKENEALMEGRPVKAVVGDAHVLHGREHKTVINDPHLRQRQAEGDPQAAAIVAETTAHLQEHEMLRMSQTPYFAEIAGEPPPPPPPMPPPGMMPPGGPMPPPGPMGGPEPTPQQPPDAPPIPDLPPEVAAG